MSEQIRKYLLSMSKISVIDFGKTSYRFWSGRRMNIIDKIGGKIEDSKNMGGQKCNYIWINNKKKCISLHNKQYKHEQNLFAQKNYTSSTYSYPKISTGIYLEWSGGSIDTEYKWNLDGEGGGKWNGVNVGRVNVEVGEEGQGGGALLVKGCIGVC